jgi:hypothetical protein
LRNLPFAFAHKTRVTPRRAAPIDHRRRVARLGGTILPKIIALPGPPAAMLAQHHGAGQLSGPRQQGRQQGRLLFGLGAQGKG